MMAFPIVSWVFLSCLMFLCHTQGDESQKEQSSPRINCPTGSKLYASHCYALFLTPKSWMEAELNCQKQPSGHLVSVLNGFEATFVATLIKSSANSYSYFWMGLHDNSEGQESNLSGWKWSNNDFTNYNAWEKTPPTTSNSFCGTLTRNSGFKKWKDYNCDSALPYVCKFKS
ncbi:regenerating islet-derived protein 3-gamma-like [Erinaceus europaeus]|uniref:Regenerating islet-derived protein 3-gamma-like n=1 Tax=Erinaceus europaeus TaxID=9365 RepID=A0A1S3ACA7_ERIEU|nr:regenerating islet-derived protein 3-gamma-like [Erinaceus europaeus]